MMASRRKKGSDDMAAKEIQDKWCATINNILETYKEANEARRYIDTHEAYLQLSAICRDCVCFLMEVEHIAK